MIRKFLKWSFFALLLFFVGSAIVVANKTSEMAANCKGNQRPSSKIEYLTFSRSKYPNIVGHIERSWKHGIKKTMEINREGARQRRDKLLNTAVGLKKWPRRRDEDRDEAPAAALRDTIKADVEYVDDNENQSAGAHLRNQMAPWCNGTKVRHRFTASSSSSARGFA